MRSEPITVARPIPDLPNARDMLFFLWAVGAGSFAVLLFIRGSQRWVLARRSENAPGELLDLLARCCTRIGVGRAPVLMTSDRVSTPMLVGLLHPTIFLPTGISVTCSDTDMAAMLMHELAHVKRRDVACLWLYHVVQVVYFFHPVVWLAGRELRKERELACDELVLSTGVSRREYAEGYVAALKMANTPTGTTVSLAMAEPFDLEKRRLQRILHQPVGRLTRRLMIALGFLGMMGLITFTGVRGENPKVPSVCRANMNGLAKYLMQYSRDHGGRLPSSMGQGWVLEASDYIPSLRILFCPNDRASLDALDLVQRELGNEASSLQILNELRTRRLRLTDYELSAAAAGMSIGQLPGATVLLDEHGPGHQTGYWILHRDWKWTRSATEPPAASTGTVDTPPAATASSSVPTRIADLAMKAKEAIGSTDWEILQCDEDPSVGKGEWKGYRILMRHTHWMSTQQSQPMPGQRSPRLKDGYSHVDLVLYGAEDDLNGKDWLSGIAWADLEQKSYVRPVYMGNGRGFAWFANASIPHQEIIRRRLGLKGGDDRVQLLLEGLGIDDEGSYTANSAEGLLARFGESIVPRITAVSRNADSELVHHAARALAAIPGDKSTRVLQEWYHSGDGDRRSAAEYALVGQPYRSLAKKEYLDMLRNGRRVSEASAACAEFGWKEAIPLLRDICASPDSFRDFRDAFEAWRTIQGKPVPQDLKSAMLQIRMNTSPDGPDMERAKRTLANSPDKEASAVLAAELALFTGKVDRRVAQEQVRIGADILRHLPPGRIASVTKALRVIQGKGWYKDEISQLLGEQ